MSKNKLTKFSLLLFVILLQSCSVDTPESYFGKAVLNVNQYIDLGSKDFQRMVETQSVNSLYVQVDGEFIMSDNFEKHIKTYKIFTLDADIEKVKSLKVTEDTKEMISASLDVLNFVKSKYETDYIEIAKLLDQKAEKTVINTAIRKFEEENLEKFIAKIDALHKLAIPYAKANGIEVSFY